MSIAAWRRPDRGHAHHSLLVATSPVRDLLLFAKHLFVAAKVAGITEQRLIALRRISRDLGWTLSNPPVRWPGGTPRAYDSGMSTLHKRWRSRVRKAR